MNLSLVEGIKITSIAAAVSNNWQSLEKFKDEEDEKVIDRFIKKTGVRGRYNAGLYQTTSDFCYAAALEILNKKNLDPKEIGAVVFVTQTSDYSVPATACVLQHRLGLSKDCIAFDVNLGCSGYVYGLNIVAGLMKISNINKALLLVGDTSAKEKSQQRSVKKDHSHKMLFGDSGTATLLEKSEDSPALNMMFRSDGSNFRAIINPIGGWRNPDGEPYPLMDDIAVFNFTISEVPLMINEFMEYLQTSPQTYDSIAMHQANLYILKQVAKKTNFPMEKVLISMDEFANTSSSSVPITLVKEYGNMKESRKVHTLLCGFGVGLSWGIADVYLNTEDILPLVHTDSYFEDGYQQENEVE